MVLGVVFLVITALAILIFAHSRMSRQQYLRIHHDEIVDKADMLALNGIYLAVEQIKSDSNVRCQLMEELRQKQFFDLNDITPNDARSFAAPVTAELLAASFDRLLATLEPLKPKCSFEVEFRNVSATRKRELPPPDRAPTEEELLRAGLDRCEKLGLLVIKCTIDYADNIKRFASVGRQFRLVSMIPGVYSRFTYFSPRTPGEDAYNVVKANYAGIYDSNTPVRRLVLINGTGTFDLERDRPPRRGSALPSDEGRLKDYYKTMLRDSGWVYAGRVPNANPDGVVPVELNIPAGYDPACNANDLTDDVFAKYPKILDDKNALGGNIYVALNILNRRGNALVPENLAFLEPAEEAQALQRGLSLKRRHVGVYSTAHTAGMNWSKGRSDGRPEPLTESDCRTSWLMPMGTRQFLSPTLMVGPVFARFLAFTWFEYRTNPTQDPPAAEGAITIEPRRVADDALGLTESFAPGELHVPTPVLAMASFSDVLADAAYAHELLPLYGNYPYPRTGGYPLGVPFNLLTETIVRPFVGAAATAPTT